MAFKGPMDDDLSNLLGQEPRVRHNTPELDDQATAWALEQIAGLDEAISQVEDRVHMLGAFFTDHTLPHAVLGAMGLSIIEVRSQLRPLREAAKEAGKS